MIDSSHNNYAITTMGALVVSGGPFFDSNCISFDGIDDYLKAPASSSWNLSDKWTIDFWMKPSGSIGRNTFVYCLDLSTNTDWSCYINTEVPNFNFEVYGPFGALTFSTPAISIDFDVWHHVAFVRNEADMYIFLDGISQTVYVTPWESFTTAGELKIGMGFDEDWFSGLLAEVRLTNNEALWTSDFIVPTYPTKGDNDPDRETIISF